MLKNISNLGTVLNKKEQKQVSGGDCAFGRKCEPWDDSSYTTCSYDNGAVITTHQSCGLNLCYGGEMIATNC
ncbi:hypothetical protein [Tenacibaculum halocynthiae]|uniref:hypothetical protein n=1 Tax=Tenacibaculum halocynthiae TaxID=1254437 RepID=UPI003D649D17